MQFKVSDSGEQISLQNFENAFSLEPTDLPGQLEACSFSFGVNKLFSQILNGDLKAETNEAQGTTFTLTLKLKRSGLSEFARKYRRMRPERNVRPNR